MDFDREACMSDLIGKTLSVAELRGDDLIAFQTDDGEVYHMLHDQNCCEHVYVEDICGDLGDLVGVPILEAEEVYEDLPALGEYDDSWTWTFYKLGTRKGHVTIRWYGTSNGYYSERVDLIRIK